jgi:hypothetical protein
LVCNLRDLNGAAPAGYDYFFEDTGDNRCHCTDSETPCVLQTVSLEPPAPP